MSFASMADIAFLLIIFFAVAGKFTQQTEREVALPPSDLGERTPPRDITVMVTRDGDLFVNESRVDAEGLRDEIAAYVTGETDPERRTVVLYADRDAEYAKVALAIDAVNQADAYLELAVRYAD